MKVVEQQTAATLQNALKRHTLTTKDMYQYNYNAALLKKEQKLKKHQINLSDEQTILQADKKLKEQAELQKRERKAKQRQVMTEQNEKLILAKKSSDNMVDDQYTRAAAVINSSTLMKNTTQAQKEVVQTQSSAKDAFTKPNDTVCVMTPMQLQNGGKGKKLDRDPSKTRFKTLIL